MVVSACVIAGTMGLSALNGDVRAKLFASQPEADVIFVDLPNSIRELAFSDLHDEILPALDGDWTEDRACQLIAQRVQSVGWVEKVNSVRRFRDGRFEVRCDFRLPFALVQRSADFFLVNDQGVRLPGKYRYDRQWMIVQGVASSPPEAGDLWGGDDIQAGLATIRAIRDKPVGDQITGVQVDNYQGRLDRHESHILLATDRAGGRIAWGSAPGEEVEENSLARKIAILRENFERTGRVDGGYAVIDISTFPDKFTIPG